MAIKILEDGIGQPDIVLSKSEHARLLGEYQQAYMFFVGTPPTFESWVRRQGLGVSLLEE